MDTQAFDTTPRRLGNGISRRGLGLGLAGVALGAAAARLPLPAAAKKKRKKKKTPPPPAPQPEPQFTTGRQTITRTFANAEQITIPDLGAGLPYPSTILVSGFANGVIGDVNLFFTNISHGSPSDIDILIVAPDGRQALVMADAGDFTPVMNVDLILDDEAAAALPDGANLQEGTFRPGNYQGPDLFPAPAPVLNGDVALSTFDGTDPNGLWRLFVADSAGGDGGDIAGWALEITAEVDVQVPVPYQTPVTTKKKRKKKKKK